MNFTSAAKPFWCLLCEYKYRNKANLKSHVRSHSEERPHGCHFCPYKSKTRVYLKNHLRKHTGEKPYSCEVCSYRCSTQGSLNIHMRVHSGEKPYFCSQCNYKYATSGALRCHYKVHSGETLYKCSVCPKSFSKLAQLRTHKNVHNADRTYRCPSCTFHSDVPEEISEHISQHDNIVRAGLSCDYARYRQVFRPTGNPNRSQYLRNLSALRSSLDDQPGSPAQHLGPFTSDHSESPTLRCGSSFRIRPGPSISRPGVFPASHPGIFPASHPCASPTSHADTSPAPSAESSSHLASCAGHHPESPETPYACIFCDRLFSDMGALKAHIAAHSDEPKLGVSWPKFSVPFSFLDGFFPTNHLSDINWNETGIPSRFNCFFSMFFEKNV